MCGQPGVEVGKESANWTTGTEEVLAPRQQADVWLPFQAEHLRGVVEVDDVSLPGLHCHCHGSSAIRTENEALGSLEGNDQRHEAGHYNARASCAGQEAGLEQRYT